MKRILATILVTFLILGTFVMSVSAEETAAEAPTHDEATCESVPVIFCEGAWHALYLNAGTPEQVEGWNTGGGGNDIVADLQKILPELPKYIRDEEWEKIADILANFTNAILGPIAFDSKGESLRPFDGDLARMNEELARDHKADPSVRAYHFNYDWRQDPWVLAERLKTFIDQVCETTGHSTVNVAAQSGSGCLFLAYLARYGTHALRAVTVRATLHEGSSIFGDVVNKRLKLDADALATTGFLRDFSVFGNPEDDDPELAQAAQKKLKTVSSALQAANQAGFLRAVSAMVNRAFPRFMDRLYDKAIIPTALTMPIFWAYVPMQDYESGKETCFGDKRGEYTELINKLDRYHYKVQVNADKLIKEAQQKIRLGYYLGTGSPLFPLLENANANSDGFVDTVYASAGATVGDPLGKKLGKLGIVFQKNKDGHDHLSPDKTIDASTCLLPEYTWFVADAPHIGGTNEPFAYWFFDSRKTQNVFSDPAYPQWLVLSKTPPEGGGDKLFVPQDNPTFWQKVTAALNPAARVKDLMLGLVNFLMFLATWWI
ncbi:MAG: hypothetical protein LBN05_04995 [Oscillospiraceae bacterium]|jgi:hypothetical protein|nr:hypothetical protein [Oscillospiraceae bacterium]